MKIAIIGLGKMGQQIAAKLIAAEHSVIGYDQNPAAAVSGAQIAHSKTEVVQAFGSGPATIWLMIPAEFVETELGEWIHALPAGSTIIDGGNSDFRLAPGRAELAAANQLHYVDVGTSGGIYGATNGFSLMVGGLETVVKPLQPVFEALALPNGGWLHTGPHGSGHFVKMVHNAIEYGQMESLAEGYHLLAEGPYRNLNSAQIAQLWQQGSIIASNLNQLTAQVLANNPALDGIEGRVAESGEARWAIEVAHSHGINLPDIEEALKIRLASQQGNVSYATKLLAALRTAFGGHNLNGK